MLQIAEKYVDLIDTAPFTLQMTTADGTVVPPKAVKSAGWTGGSNSGDDITLGSTVAIQLKVELDREKLGGIDVSDARLKAALVLQGEEDSLQIPWGELQVTDDDSDDDSVNITAGDAMLWAFSTQYALDDAALGFDWEAGVDGETLLQAICDACGVTLRTTGLRQITLANVSPSGYTYREVIAFLACMWGCFARMDGEGQLVLRWYTQADRPITASRYYDGGLVKADYGYTVGYIKCYVETLEETLVVGDATKAQGIYIKCPWMTLECLQAVWETVGGFSYRPVSELRFLGDPRLEPGDVLQVTDRDGTVYSVPCMTLCHEFDGGLISEITAVGKSSSATDKDYQGPVTRQIERAFKQINANIIKYEDRLEAFVKDEMSEQSATFEMALDGIQAQVTENAEKYTSISQSVEDVTAQVVDNTKDLSLTLRIGADGLTITDANGNTVEIDGKQLKANSVLADLITAGILQSKDGKTFVLDLDNGTFSMQGSGRFQSPDGRTYISVEGDEMVMYAWDEKSGAYLDKIHFGFITGTNPADSESTLDYPYMLLGKSGGAVGMIKEFYNGLWLGNSVPKDASGNFEGMEGAAGFFINTRTGVVYVVNGTDMQNVYTGAAIAKFK